MSKNDLLYSGMVHLPGCPYTAEEIEALKARLAGELGSRIAQRVDRMFCDALFVCAPPPAGETPAGLLASDGGLRVPDNLAAGMRRIANQLNRGFTLQFSREVRSLAYGRIWMGPVETQWDNPAEATAECQADGASRSDA